MVCGTYVVVSVWYSVVRGVPLGGGELGAVVAAAHGVYLAVEHGAAEVLAARGHRRHGRPLVGARLVALHLHTGRDTCLQSIRNSTYIHLGYTVERHISDKTL